MVKEFGLAALGVALAGVFVGAVTIEVLHRKCPDLIRKTEEKARETVASLGQTIESVKEAFKEGYTQAN